MENKENLANYAKHILEQIGIQYSNDFINHNLVANAVETKRYILHDVEIKVEIIVFENKTCRVDINFYLPENGVLANTFMNHCAAIERIPKNHAHEYCAGPMYPDYITELRASKRTFALSPWNNTMFYVRSEGYPLTDIQMAVDNALVLAMQFVRHLGDHATLRYWNPTDVEVIAKAKEIVRNANLQDVDVDKEEKAHWLHDANSFFKAWFFPFTDKGKGSFGIVWPSSLSYAAGMMGIRGSFEYAVACVLLQDPDFIAKAKKTCHIFEETVRITY